MSGGKTILVLKRAGFVGGSLFFVGMLGAAWFGPDKDRTYYVQTSERQDGKNVDSTEPPVAVNEAVLGLLDSGQRKMENERRDEMQRKKQKVAIKYFAPQVVGSKSRGPRSIQLGSKLVGFLMTAIDTRSQSLAVCFRGFCSFVVEVGT